MVLDLKKVAIPGSAVVGILMGAFMLYFWAEDHYALAANVASKDQMQQLEQRVYDMRKEQLENRIFELDLIPEEKRTIAQKAMRARYQTQLDAIIREENR